MGRFGRVALAAVSSLLLVGGWAGPTLARQAPAQTTPEGRALFRELMERNGSMGGIRNLVLRHRTETRDLLQQSELERALTAAEETRFETLADAEYAAAQERIVAGLVAKQSGAFTPDQLRRMINAASSPAAARYFAVQYQQDDDMTAKVENRMVQAIVKVVQTWNSGGSIAIEPPPKDLTTAFGLRVSAARDLLRVDGSEAVVIKTIRNVHGPMIIAELANHIDFDKLSEADRQRLSTLYAVEVTNLAAAVNQYYVYRFATAMSLDELNQLKSAMDTPEQALLAKIRVEDDGSFDVEVEETLNAVRQKIFAAFP